MINNNLKKIVQTPKVFNVSGYYSDLFQNTFMII